MKVGFRNTVGTYSTRRLLILKRKNPFAQSKKSPTGPSERTPKPEYLIARLQLTERGPLGFGPIRFLMDPAA